METSLAWRQWRVSMEKSNVFLDTNIIIDILCMRDGYEAAASVLQMGMNGEVELFMTNLTLANTLYIVRKDLGKETALEKMKALCKIVHIAPSGQTETDKAFATKNPDFEDALQNYSAEAISADVILTRNEKHFRYSEIQVMNCMTYLNSF